MKNSIQKGAEKGNHLIQIRLTKSQKERLIVLAEASGFNTLSQFIRCQCLSPSIEMKLNQILQIMEEKNANRNR